MTIPVRDEEIVVEGEEKEGENNDDDSDNERREFPKPFYDPITGQLMKDPVVNPAGDSYEKSTISDTSTAVTYYPNRALKSIIQRQVELATPGSLRGNLRRIDEKIQQSFGRLLEKSAFGIEHRPLPESYYCPITCELMTDPVISKDGNSYEREAIENWIRVNGVSPLTRSPLTITELRENNALYDLIQLEKERSDESMHPSIRRWKASGAPSRRPLQQAPEPSAPPADTLAAAPQTTTPVIAAAGTTNNYPTTQAEIRARRRQQRASNWTCVAIVITVVLFFVFPGYVGAIALVVLIGLLIALCCQRCDRCT